MTRPPFVIREIGAHDVDQTIALWQAAALIQPWNDPEADIATARKDPNATVLVAALEATQVCATTMVSENGRRGEVCYVAVGSPWRGTGLGRRILQAAEHWLLARNVPALELRVHEDNTHAQGFYAHLGYREIGRLYYRKDLIALNHPR